MSLSLLVGTTVADETAESHQDMNIKVAAPTVKSQVTHYKYKKEDYRVR